MLLSSLPSSVMISSDSLLSDPSRESHQKAPSMSVSLCINTVILDALCCTLTLSRLIISYNVTISVQSHFSFDSSKREKKQNKN